MPNSSVFFIILIFLAKEQSALAATFSENIEASTNNVDLDKNNQQKKLKLEDLLIWKMLDELKLTPEQEQKITVVIKNLNKKKSENSEKIEQLTKQFIKEANVSLKEKILLDLKKAYQQHSVINLEELDTVKKTIGIKKLAEYLDIKKDLSEKMKNLIVPGDKKGEKKLPPPKVIEEK
ncbi:MAG: hypothetical protein HUU56_02530 [Bdellovibrionaceae bacterium]|nr:hypothetical protein [Pseudobdellovibrionaceae bacterium]